MNKRQLKKVIVALELKTHRMAIGATASQRRELTKTLTLINRKLDEVLIASTSDPIGAVTKQMELSNLISSRMSILTDVQQKMIETTTNEIYRVSRSTINDLFNSSFNVVSSQQRSNVSTAGLASTYSSRVYTNNQIVGERINKDIRRMLYNRANPTEIKRTIRKDLKISENAADRLVRTEGSRFYNQAALDGYRDAGITEIEFLAEDNACEEECQPNNGKIFAIGDSSHCPPLHPNCRCTLLPVIK